LRREELIKKIREIIPGFLITLAIALISYITWWILKDTWIKFSALLWSFLFSIIVINVIPMLSERKFAYGIEICSTKLLRWTIALLGLTISASVWVQLGGAGIAVVVINLVIIFLFGLVFCKYVLGINNALAILIAVGTSICGATAIAAVGPAIKAKAEEMGLSLAVVTLFGLLAMFTYPLLFSGPLEEWFNSNPLAYGLWAGTGIHETAQVIAAASQVESALSTATAAKFIRIFLIGPMVFISLFMFRRFSSNEEIGRIKLAVPWFAVVFVVLSLVHLGLESLPIRDWWLTFNSSYIKPAVTFLLALSFAAIGLKVRISAIRAIGLKAFIGGIVVAVLAGVTSLLLVKLLWLPFNG
jgi:uncharacterized integral membrane protein (TIGR00698 family)